MGDKLGRKVVENAESALRNRGKSADAPAEAAAEAPAAPEAPKEAPEASADDSTHGTPKRHL